jgi:hypothetical protein
MRRTRWFALIPVLAAAFALNSGHAHHQRQLRRRGQRRPQQTLTPGSGINFGMIVSGSSGPVPTLTCYGT